MNIGRGVAICVTLVLCGCAADVGSPTGPSNEPRSGEWSMRVSKGDVSPEEESSAVDDWVLLLQISNDDDLALDLGDASRLFVWIRRDDLAAGRFDAVQAFER